MAMSDQEIRAKLKPRTTTELLAFREKLRKMDTPQAWGIRFHIMQELLFRHLFTGEDIWSGGNDDEDA